MAFPFERWNNEFEWKRFRFSKSHRGWRMVKDHFFFSKRYQIKSIKNEKNLAVFPQQLRHHCDVTHILHEA